MTAPRTPAIDTQRVAAMAGEVLGRRFNAVPTHDWGSTVAEFLAAKPTPGSLGIPLCSPDPDRAWPCGTEAS